MVDNRKYRQVLFGSAVLLFLVSMFFSLITPVFSGPDDDYHLASIWCADGERSEKCEDVYSDEYTTYGKVPGELFELLNCKTRNISESPSCDSVDSSRKPSYVRISNDAYPKGYYKFFNLFISDDVESSILTMRLVNSLVLFLAFLIAMMILPLKSTQRMLTSTYLLFLPFPLFLMGTNNPQSWSVFLVIPMYFVMSQVLRNLHDTKNSFFLAQNVFLLMGALMMIVSRGDGIYLLLFLVVTSSITQIRNFSSRLSFILVSWITIIFVLDSIFGPKDLNLSAAKMESDGKSYFLHNILELPGFILGIFGGKGDSGYLSLGSYDLPLPSLAWTSISLGLLAILLINFTSAIRLFAFFIAILGVCFIALYGMHEQSANTSGFFQPRYLLPFIFVSVLVKLEDSYDKAGSTRIIFVVSFLFIGFMTFVYAVILRYSSGINVEESKYLQLFSIPNQYVSKSTIRWGQFSGEINGILPMDSTVALLVLVILWMSISISQIYILRSQEKIDSVSQRKTLFGVNPLLNRN